MKWGLVMHIPKYIRKKIRRRTKLAQDLIVVCNEIDDWLERKGVLTYKQPYSDVTVSGCMIYCEPATAERVLIEALEQEREYE